jgi:putative transposase
MQSVGRRYVPYFNYRYSRSGTLWEGRFKACLVQLERYLLECYGYIELNPVRAYMVACLRSTNGLAFKRMDLGRPPKTNLKK